VWKEIFEFIFFIEPASGFIIIDLILPSALSLFFYPFAFKSVGNMYRSRLIRSYNSGSALHWFVRLFLVYIVIFVFNIVYPIWPWFLATTGFLFTLWYAARKIHR
jgi:hypothetical protein